MGQPILRDGVAERAHDVILTEDIGEGLRAVFSGEDLVTHAALYSGPASLSYLIFLHFSGVLLH